MAHVLGAAVRGCALCAVCSVRMASYAAGLGGNKVQVSLQPADVAGAAHFSFASRCHCCLVSLFGVGPW